MPDTGIDHTGFTDNWWIGLAMLHTLFALRAQPPLRPARVGASDWNDEQLFETAKLINSAIMAKIHTIEWTPAILPNPITKLAMHVNWSGVVDEIPLQESSSSSARTSCSAASSDRTPSITARRTR